MATKERVKELIDLEKGPEQTPGPFFELVTLAVTDKNEDARKYLAETYEDDFAKIKTAMETGNPKFLEQGGPGSRVILEEIEKSRGGFSIQDQGIQLPATPASTETKLPEFKPVSTDKLDVKFEDIIGNEEAKKQIIKNYILPINFPGLFQNPSRNLLLYGPPGTGKTMFARATAASLENTLFFAPNTGELKGAYLGETDKYIAHLFDTAQKLAEESGKRSIIFLDELETLGANRQNTVGEGTKNIVSVLLRQMDGFEKKDRVSVIGATNLPGDLDPAILRRFVNQVYVRLPNTSGVLTMIHVTLASRYGASPIGGKGLAVPDQSDPERRKIIVQCVDSKGDFRECEHMKNINKYGAPGRTVSKNYLKGLAKVLKDQLYSASEVQKLVESAMNNAAYRTVQAIEVDRAIRVSHKLENPDLIVVREAVGAETPDPELKEISRPASQIITLDIQKDDFIEALEYVRPATSVEDWIRLQNYYDPNPEKKLALIKSEN